MLRIKENKESSESDSQHCDKTKIKHHTRHQKIINNCSLRIFFLPWFSSIFFFSFLRTPPVRELPSTNYQLPITNRPRVQNVLPARCMFVWPWVRVPRVSPPTSTSTRTATGGPTTTIYVREGAIPFLGLSHLSCNDIYPPFLYKRWSVWLMNFIQEFRLCDPPITFSPIF